LRLRGGSGADRYRRQSSRTNSYDADRDAVIARAQAAGVVQMVITGSTLASTQRALALRARSPATTVCHRRRHPHHASELTAAARGRARGPCPATEVVAVGECGSITSGTSRRANAQRQAFHRQLELAAKLGKPVFLHQREAHADFAAILREHGAQWRGVAHCFTGPAQELTCYLQLGLAIGITGWICDERRGRHLAALMPQIPAERLLLETDAPYLLPRDLNPNPPRAAMSRRIFDRLPPRWRAPAASRSKRSRARAARRRASCLGCRSLKKACGGLLRIDSRISP